MHDGLWPSIGATRLRAWKNARYTRRSEAQKLSEMVYPMPSIVKKSNIETTINHCNTHMYTSRALKCVVCTYVWLFVSYFFFACVHKHTHNNMNTHTHKDQYTHKYMLVRVPTHNYPKTYTLTHIHIHTDTQDMYIYIAVFLCICLQSM
jgi:hypothetical protein